MEQNGRIWWTNITKIGVPDCSTRREVWETVHYRAKVCFANVLRMCPHLSVQVTETGFVFYRYFHRLCRCCTCTNGIINPYDQANERVVDARLAEIWNLLDYFSCFNPSPWQLLLFPCCLHRIKVRNICNFKMHVERNTERHQSILLSCFRSRTLV